MVTELVDNDNLNNEITQWGLNYLLSHGYTLKNNLSEMMQNTPWSQVIRFETTVGYVYLKHTPKLLALEPNISQLLRDQFHASVPEIIGVNHELDCFLMKDAGRPLREILKKQFDVELIFKAIDQFTSIQLSASNHVNTFLEMGVPDWRLNKLPDLFRQLLTQKDLLIEDGLSEKEINQLEPLVPIVARLCNELSTYAIKQTIVQPDFNDNNALVDDQHHNITIIDLGEIAISYPFFPLIIFLQQIKKHHGLTEDDHSYQKIKNAYLNNFLIYETQENLLNAFEISRPLWLIYNALAGYRLINACGQSKIMAYQHGKLISSLKEFIAACDRLKDI